MNHEGDGVTIHDNRAVCAHAGRCTNGPPVVFRVGQEPFVDAKGASADEIIATVKQCPSGALSYSAGETRQQDHQASPAIFVAKNGPYVVTGGPDLAGEIWGDGVSREHFTLCRCGHSKNKPFCDGTHWSVEFTDDGN